MAQETAAEKAFKAAQKAIAEAAKSGATELRLFGQTFAALQRLPEEIAGLTGLTTLVLTGTKVGNLEPVRGLTGLSRVLLSRTEVSDLEPLRGLANLTVLSFSGSNVKDLEPLRGLLDVTLLSFSATGVSDLEPLHEMRGLAQLSLSDTKVSNLEPLRGLTNLTELFLAGNSVSDLEPLRGLTHLMKLDLADTGVTDLDPLRGLTGLTALELSGTRVSRGALRAGLRGKTSLIPGEQRNALAGPFGVHLKECRAAQEDARIAEIAGIEDDRERTIALFEELGLEWRDVAPDPDPLVPVKIEDGKLEITPSFPSADELEERLKRSLHDRLRPKAAEAAQKAGN
jgi:hypothetical protein